MLPLNWIIKPTVQVTEMPSIYRHTRHRNSRRTPHTRDASFCAGIPSFPPLPPDQPTCIVLFPRTCCSRALSGGFNLRSIRLHRLKQRRHPPKKTYRFLACAHVGDIYFTLRYEHAQTLLGTNHKCDRAYYIFPCGARWHDLDKVLRSLRA